MDLAKIAKNAAAIGMRIAGTAKVQATIFSGQDKAFDWGTDTATESGGSSPTVWGVKYQLKQVQGTGETSWQTEFLIEGVDAPAGIDEAARIEIGSEKWNIANVNHIPTEAVIIFGLRK
jgi:hypothetical protein